MECILDLPEISPEQFYFLLLLVNENITAQPGFRLPIPADMKLAVTLRYLAAGKWLQLLALYAS